MNILQILGGGISATKYGSLEHYFHQLVKLNGDDKYFFIYDAPIVNKVYERDMISAGAKILVIDPSQSFMSYILAIYRIIREQKIKIVQFHFGNYKYAFFLRLLCPNVTFFALYHLEAYYPLLRTRLAMRLYHCAFKRIFCVSEGVKRGLEKTLGKSKKFQVLYLGVRKRPILNLRLKETLNIPVESLVISCFGFNIKVKGLDILISAIKNIISNNSTTKFKVLIVGVVGDENDKLIKLIKDADLEDHIISLGIRNDIDDILNITDIYVQPSRTEALSLSILEAMNYAIPIIASNVGGIPEVVQDGYNGYLFEKENSSELSEKLTLLINDENTRSLFGMNSKKLSRNFSLDKSVQELSAIYHKK